MSNTIKYGDTVFELPSDTRVEETPRSIIVTKTDNSGQPALTASLQLAAIAGNDASQKLLNFLKESAGAVEQPKPTLPDCSCGC